MPCIYQSSNLVLWYKTNSSKPNSLNTKILDFLDNSFLSYIASNSAMLLIYSFIIGAFIGSFLNVVIHRIPIMLERQWKNECHELLNPDIDAPIPAKYNLSVPRSHCPSCNHQVKAIESIPIISYLFL